MTNREILCAQPELLDEVDRQRQFLLRVELTAMPGPACGRGPSYLDAARIDIDDYDCDNAMQHECVCPCGADLEQVVPAFAGGDHLWRWQLRPSWLHTQLEKARAYDRLPREE